MAAPVISKTRYIQGLQCPKLLWHLYNAHEVFPPTDPGTQAVLDQGHEVGRLAQELFPAGIRVPDGIPPDEVVSRSRGLVPRRLPLFEAGFRFSEAEEDARAGAPVQVYARADILEPVDRDVWNIVEVKSSAHVGDPYWDDLAIQRYCYEGAGLSIRGCAILHVNSAYVRKGAVDPAQLFTRTDVTASVERKLPAIPRRIRQMVKVIQAARSPAVEIGPQCSAPYTCPLVPMCWKGVENAPRSIFSLARIGSRSWKLYRSGVRTTDRIPRSFRLTAAQQIQVQAEKTGKVHVNARAVKKFLGALRYPIHYLDFETFAAAVPPLEGTRPYQQIPFQFSLHVAAAAGTRLQHFSWLWDGRGDPMALLLQELKRVIAPEGSIVAYAATFERQRLQECAAAHLEEAAWVAEILDRLVDLLAPFRSFSVYHPAQAGSASMKRVLPALTGSGYEHLEIREGGQASLEFRRITFGEVSEAERRRVRARLEDYCGVDTRGMADIVRTLQDLVSRSP